jgi:hypothetical protein
MDETQRRKISAKEFLDKNRRIGYLVGGIFSLLFLSYFLFVYYYSHFVTTSETATSTVATDTANWVTNLLPVFNSSEAPNTDTDDILLSNFKNSNLKNIDGRRLRFRNISAGAVRLGRAGRRGRGGVHPAVPGGIDASAVPGCGPGHDQDRRYRR